MIMQVANCKKDRSPLLTRSINQLPDIPPLDSKPIEANQQAALKRDLKLKAAAALVAKTTAAEERASLNASKKKSKAEAKATAKTMTKKKTQPKTSAKLKNKSGTKKHDPSDDAHGPGENGTQGATNIRQILQLLFQI